MSFEAIIAVLRDDQTQQLIWTGVAGACLVFLQSILSGTRRAWYRLLASALIGGCAAALTGYVFEDSKWVYFYCGVAAIMAENVIFGLFNASEQFKENPINVFAQLWRIVVPAFGVTTDKAGLDLPAADMADREEQRKKPKEEEAAG